MFGFDVLMFGRRILRCANRVSYLVLLLGMLSASLAMPRAYAADLLLNNVAAPTVVGAGAGKRALWANAGTVGGTPVDLVATITEATLDHALITQDNRPAIRSVGQDNVWLEWRIYAAGTYNVTSNTGGTPVAADVYAQLNDIDGPNNEQAFLPVCDGTIDYVRIERVATLGRSFGTVSGRSRILSIVGDQAYAQEDRSGVEAFYPNTSVFRYGRTGNNNFYLRLKEKTLNPTTTLDYKCGDFTTPIAANDTKELLPGAVVTLNILQNDTVALDNATGLPSEYGQQAVVLTTPAGATNVVTDADGHVTGFTVPGEGIWSYNDATGVLTYTPQVGFTTAPTPITYYFIDGIRPTPVNSNFATVTITVPQIGIVLSSVRNDNLVADGRAQPGETVTYTYEVRSLGTSPLSNVALTQSSFSGTGTAPVPVLASGDTNGNGLLDTGETWIYTAVYTLTASDVTAGTLTHQETATGRSPQGTVTTDLSDSRNPVDGNGVAAFGPGTGNNDPTTTTLPRPIDAVDDSAGPIPGATGQANVLNVLTNDTLIASPATTSNVTISVVTPASNANVALDIATGNVSVAAGTPAGPYAITYRICEIASPANCDDANATVTVGAPVIDAVNDGPVAADGSVGQANVVNVLGNDTLNATAATTSRVTIGVITPASNANVSLDTVTGDISVAAGTPAGSYSIVYRICEILNPTNCDNATASIQVNPGLIDAVDDAPAASIDGTAGATNVVNVFTNDTLSGVAVNPAALTTTVLLATDPKVSLNTSTGQVSVAQDTPAGTYTINYQICETANPANCDTATVSVTVVPGTIDAIDDAPAAVSGLTGNPNIGNAFANDTLSGVAANASRITASIITAPANAGVKMDLATGVLSVDANTPAGTYTIDYQICERANPSNCDTATATIVVNAPVIDAQDDAPAPVVGSAANPNVVNIFTNDTLGGAPVTPSGLTTTIQNPAANPNIALDTSTGVVSLTGPVAAGTYTIDYRICETINPGNCDDATVTLQITAGAIVAVNDTPAGANGISGEANVVNVLTNDTLNGISATTSNVSITVTNPASDPGVSLDPATGIVSVAAGTPAAIYTIDYQICEIINSGNCATAAVTVDVNASTIAAINDDPPTIVGPAANPNVINAYANDTFNGAPINLADVTATIVAASSNPNVSLDLTNGTVSVAANTPAGAYTIVYQLCEVVNPTVCDQATITVRLDPAPIDAVDDAPAAVAGTTATPNLVNAFANDTLDGAVVTPSTVTATITTPSSNPNVAMDPASGNVSVAAGTPEGTYTIIYQICEILNPGNCDSATVIVIISAGTLVAADDAPGAVDGTAGTPNVVNAYANDTLNGIMVNPSAITGTVLVPATNNGVALDPASGQVSVAAGTPAGTYSITYRICENLNPLNCDDGVITVVVNAGTIDAVADAPPAVVGATGSTNLVNVLSNDTLNGSAVTTSNVVLTVVNPASNGGVSLNTSTGVVSVAVGVPAGTYTIGYQICETLNPTNCDTADVTVTVTAAGVTATADTFPPVNGSTGSTNAGNVLSNDTLNGQPAAPPAVTVIVTAPASNANVALDPATGVISVAPGTPGGTYTIGYQVCETINPTNCNVAVATIEVTAPELRATDDAVPGIVDSANAQAGVVNVLTNDTLAGSAATPATVTVTPAGALPAGFTLNPDGTVDVAAFTASGTYTFAYTACEIGNPTNCATGNVTITVKKSVPAVSGTVYLDRNGNGALDAGDSRLGGYTVHLRQGSTIIASTTTGSDGTYLINDFAPGSGYDVVFIDPKTNIAVGRIPNLTFAANTNLTDQNKAIDPSGVIYNSATGAPLSGVTLQLANSSNTPLPAICLLPGQQGQTTGADGGYRFDIVPGASTECPATETEYRLVITSYPPGVLPQLSAVVPPQSGALDATTCPVDAVPGGACQLSASSAAPSPGAPTPYYLIFLIAAGDPDVINNHIPLDPANSIPASGITITKRANVAVIRRDEVATYVIVATNSNPTAAGPVTIQDRLPTDFAFVPNSATLDGVSVTPSKNARTLTFTNVVIPAQGSVEIRLAARVGADVKPGEHINEAFVVDPATGAALTAIAKAAIRVVAEHVFDCGEIIGKVFDDRNRDGSQDDGEKGLPGVRVVTVNGLLISTDKQGRFSVPCAELPDQSIGSNFILKLDPRTLPDGFGLTTENPKVVRLTAGKVTKLNFGATVANTVKVQLTGRAFRKGAAEPTGELRAGISQLADIADKRGSSLKITYRANGEPPDLVKIRLKQVRTLVASVWREDSRALPFEVLVVGSE